tara:strand:- start:6397 stop:6831 length:435 start_codon:yes stop_codon:yes gene_type:complete
MLTNKLYQWLVREKKRKFPNEEPKGSTLLKRVINTLLVVLAILAISYLFVENEDKGEIMDDFKTVLYIGIVMATTIIIATSANLWFKYDIQKKIENQHDPTSIKFLRYIVLVGIYFTGTLLCLLAFPSLKGITQTALEVLASLH